MPTKKVRYEENPWGDDAPVPGRRLDRSEFPSREELKKAKIRYINEEEEEIAGLLPRRDVKPLLDKAKHMGISPRALVMSVLHDYVHGRLTRV